MLGSIIIVFNDLNNGLKTIRSCHTDMENARAALWNIAYIATSPEYNHEDYIFMKDGILYSESEVANVEAMYRSSYQILDLNKINM